jgi:2-methylfumaryl-CoA hydratase
MSKNRLRSFFEDFHPGQTFQHDVPRTLSEGDRAAYIGRPDRAARSALNTAATPGLQGQPLEDHLVFNVVFGKTVPELSTNAVANLGYADLRLAPVYPGARSVRS